jgi:hypothetical protein
VPPDDDLVGVVFISRSWGPTSESRQQLAEAVKHERDALFEIEVRRVDADGLIPLGTSRVLRPCVLLLHPLPALRRASERLVERRQKDDELPQQPIELRPPVVLEGVRLEHVVDRNIAAAVGKGASERGGRLDAEPILRRLEIARLLRVGTPADDQVPNLVEFDVRRLRTGCAPRASKRRFACPRGPPKSATTPCCPARPDRRSRSPCCGRFSSGRRGSGPLRSSSRSKGRIGLELHRVPILTDC